MKNNQYTFDSDEKISKFLKQVECHRFSEQLVIAEDFLLTIFHITTGNLKQDVKKLLIKIFNGSKQQANFDSDYVIFGLNLFILDIINLKELSFIFEKLKKHIQECLEQNFRSTDYLTIKKQLEKMLVEKPDIDRDALDFDNVLKNVSELTDKMSKSFFI